MTNENEIGKIYAFAFKPGENTGNLGDIFGYLAIEKLSKRTLRRTGIPEKDNIVRSARVKTPNGELIRPVSKLCLLEEAV